MYSFIDPLLHIHFSAEFNGLNQKEEFLYWSFQDLMPEDIIMRGTKYGNFYIHHKSLAIHI